MPAMTSKTPHSPLPTPLETTGAISGDDGKDDDADFVCRRALRDTPSCKLLKSRRVMVEVATDLISSELRHHA